MVTKQRTDVNAEVTARLIAGLKDGKAPWQRPYLMGMPRSMSTGRPYRGINPFLLMLAQDADGNPVEYSSPWWGTYRQISEKGGQVRKGEKSTRIVFWKVKEVTEDDGEVKNIFFGRFFNVFNAEQADGLPDKYYSLSRDFVPKDEAQAVVDAYFGHPHSPTLASERQDLAFYRPSTDTVSLPHPRNIVDTDAYYSTAFHEMTHSTGHESRLAREEVTNLDPFHREKGLIAKEELVAEMGAAMVCAQVGITTTLDNSAAYLRSWIKALDDDPKMAVQAASRAQKAVDLILGTLDTDEEDEDS